jgi:hypothetical protein
MIVVKILTSALLCKSIILLIFKKNIVRGNNREELDASNVCTVFIYIVTVIKCKSYLFPLCWHVEFVTLIIDPYEIFEGSQSSYEKTTPYA